MNVKVKKRGRPSSGVTQLRAERIVFCARQLLKESGKVPSIRKLATELEVDPMAIYHYFANKAALLEAVTVSLISEVTLPAEKADWPDEVKALCQRYLQLLTEHQGLLETMLTMPCGGPAHLFSERLAVILTPLQLSDEAFKKVLNLLADYLHGVVLAKRCNPNEQTVGSIDGPLSLIFIALQHQADSPARK